MGKRTVSEVPEDEILNAIARVAAHIDNDGNRGIYAHSIPDAWVLKPYFKKYRDGILYFNTGRGWRVRKKPKHWRDVLHTKVEAWRPTKISLNDIPA